MADRKISDLTALTTPASGDFLPIVDISEAAAASKNKRITIEELMRGMPDGTAAAPSIAFESDPNTGIYSPGADQVAISTAGTGRLFVDASGKVLVNDSASITSNAAGYVQIRQTNAGGETALTVINSSNSDAAATVKIKAGQATRNGGEIVFGKENASDWATTASADGYLAFAPVLNNTNTERMRITSAGLLGLGTSAPQAELNVAKVGGASTVYIESDAGNNATTSILRFGGASGRSASIQGFRGASSNIHSLDFYTYNSADAFGMRLTPTGLGIGTTSPSVALDVNGNGSFKSSILVTDSQTKIGDSGVIDGGAADGNTQINFFSGKSLILKTGGSERARLDSSGRLLVGTSTARGNFYNGSFSSALQLEGTGTNRRLSITGADEAGVVILARQKSGSAGGNTILADGDSIGVVTFQGNDGSEFVEAATIAAHVDGTPGANDMPGRLVFSTTADGAASVTERLRITSAGVLRVADAGNIAVGTTTGTKIGTATTQKIGFYNATPVVQPAAVADATDAATVITQLNDLLAKLRTLGIIAT